jgi:hypothetical protein
VRVRAQTGLAAAAPLSSPPARGRPDQAGSHERPLVISAKLEVVITDDGRRARQRRRHGNAFGIFGRRSRGVVIRLQLGNLHVGSIHDFGRACFVCSFFFYFFEFWVCSRRSIEQLLLDACMLVWLSGWLWVIDQIFRWDGSLAKGLFGTAPTPAPPLLELKFTQTVSAPLKLRVLTK